MTIDNADLDATAATVPAQAPTALLALTWRYHRQWSLAASAAKERLDRRRQWNLVLLVIGALAAAGTAQDGFAAGVTTTLAVTAALALAIAGLVQTNGLNGDQTARWIRARAASEALKAEVYRYLIRVAPYAGPDRDDVLQAQLAVVQDRANTQLLDQQTTSPDHRPLPTMSSVAEYVTDRAQSQADWHRTNSRLHATKARGLRIGQLVVTGIGAIISALTAALPALGLSTWAAAATTIAAAIGAQLAATQHQRVAEGYAATTDQLDRLTAQFVPATATPAQQAQLVADVERVLAAQNDGWTDLFSAKPPTAPSEGHKPPAP